jgi:hypothetical protein
MERSTPVPMGMGEQSLTPGEQRILALMEQGQQRLEQRLQSLEAGQKRTDQRLDSMDRRLTELKFEVAQEATRGKLRDRDLASQLQHSQDEHRERNVWLVGELKSAQQATLQAMYVEMNSFRTLLSERL